MKMLANIVSNSFEEKLISETDAVACASQCSDRVKESLSLNRNKLLELDFYKFLVGFIVVFFLISFTQKPLANDIPKKEIEESLKSYVSAFGCIGGVKKIIKIEKKYRSPSNQEFLVLFSVNRGCASGMNYVSVFAVFSYSNDFKPVVVPEKSFPSAKMIGFPVKIDDIFYEDDQLLVRGKNFRVGDDGAMLDSLCCPKKAFLQPFQLSYIDLDNYPDLEVNETKWGSSGENRYWFFIVENSMNE